MSVECTEAVNLNFNPGIGYLQPAKVLGEDGDIIVKDRLREIGRFPELPSLKEQEKELKVFKNDPTKKSYQIGSHVLGI